jgi:hypothetical protein
MMGRGGLASKGGSPTTSFRHMDSARSDWLLTLMTEARLHLLLECRPADDVKLLLPERTSSLTGCCRSDETQHTTGDQSVANAVANNFYVDPAKAWGDWVQCSTTGLSMSR